MSESSDEIEENLQEYFKRIFADMDNSFESENDQAICE
jgi:hypothetical protein